MVDSIKLHLENMGPVNEANINISDITLVGGHNSTGKSTLSKLLYSFLRSNSLNRQEIAYDSISKLIYRQTKYILREFGAQDAIKLRKIKPWLRFLRNSDFEGFLDSYEEFKSQMYRWGYGDEFDERFKVIDDLVQVIEDDSQELYVSLMRTLMESEFLSNNFCCYIDIQDNQIDFKNHDFDDDGAFTSQDNFIVNDVFYIDSVSVLDTFDNSVFSNKNKIRHIDHLKSNLTDKNRDVFDEKINKNVIDLEKEINEIINGKFILEQGEFKFITNENIKSNMQNTASGIKQIGLIQILLLNRKLTQNSFLIIDEPEVNLHPEWQFKLAKILVLISKKLNISVYINTHSPLFIESIHTYADYYDVLDKTTYHMAEIDGDTVKINEVDESDLSRIYDDLGKPYFDMDIIRLEKEID